MSNMLDRLLNPDRRPGYSVSHEVREIQEAILAVAQETRELRLHQQRTNELLVQIANRFARASKVKKT